MTRFRYCFIAIATLLFAAQGYLAFSQNLYEDHSERMYRSAERKYSLDKLENQRIDL